MSQYFELYKVGYVHEDGKEEENCFVKKANSKEALIKYAVSKKLDLQNHYINTVKTIIIKGVLVPETINEQPEYLYEIIKM